MVDLSASNDLVQNICDNSHRNTITHFWLGRREYSTIWNIQKTLHSMIKNESLNDLVLYLEHDNVYTLGKNSNSDHILPSSPPNIEIIQSDRGGDVTYHGPGQLVGYPILNLNNYTKSISWYMRSLEEVIILVLNGLDISSSVKDGQPGVWIEDEKICAMGVRMAQWTTMHGFALNVHPNLDYFDGMIPCGIFEYGVTSIFKQINKKLEVSKIANTISINIDLIFSNNYNIMLKEC